MASHMARNATLAIVIVLAIGVAAGFVIMVPVTSKTPVTVAVETPTEVTYETSSQILVTVSQASTATQSVWQGSDISLQPNHYDSYTASFSVGTNVQFQWSASIKVDVYVFNAAEFSAYQTSGTTSPNLYTNNAQSGSYAFYVAGADTYYLVIHDPNGLLGIGASAVGYTTSGTESYPTTTFAYITQTTTYLTSSQSILTSTVTTTTTKSCSTPFWDSLGSPTCP